MRRASIVSLLLACTALAVAGPSWADTWSDPGAVDEALCAVSHAGEDHSGESALGFTFDGVPFAGSNLTGVEFTSASLGCVDDDTLTCDGRCVDFTTTNLTDAILQLADVQGADLSGATLTDAVLTGADLRDTILDGADLSGADLEQALLSDAQGQSVDGAPTMLDGASLRGATLLRADFSGSGIGTGRTDFTSADLRTSATDCGYLRIETELEDGTIEVTFEPFDCPSFTNADFHGVDFRNAIWRFVDLGGASFVQNTAPVATNLRGARFESVDLVGAGATGGADLSGVDLGFASITDSTFFTESATTPGTYVEAILDGTLLDDADLAGAILCHPLDFTETDMSGDYCVAPLSVTCADWTDGADDPPPSLLRASLRGAWAPGVDFAAFDLRGTDLRLADLRCAELFGTQLQDARVDGADFAGADLTDGGADPATADGLLGTCVVPEPEDNEIPQPRCPRFDGARADGLLAVDVILNGVTFIDAELAGAELTRFESTCIQLPVDPELNGKLELLDFCADFTGADLTGVMLDEALFTAPVFEAILGDGLVLKDAESFCIDGFLPAVDEDSNPTSHRFCARFDAASLVQADFTGAILREAEFGCLIVDDGVTDPGFDCATLRGTVFDDFGAVRSTWSGPIDLTDDGLVHTRFAGATLGNATITCEGFTYTRDVGGVDVVSAKQGCPDFAGAVLTPDVDLSSATLLGIDWSARPGWTPDLTGADLSDANLGCFEFTYTDENDEEQTLGEICTSLEGAILVDVDFSGAELGALSLAGSLLDGADFESVDLSGIDFSGTTMVGARLVSATTDAATRFEPGYDPGSATGDDIKDGCTSSSPVDLRGAELDGLDLTDVVDFGGTCIIVDKSTTYSDDTLGLTAATIQQITWIPVPEPGAAAAHAAALATLALLARRARKRQG